MRHKKLNKRFGRSYSERKELMRSLARNTIIYSRIKTTLPKAKEARKLVDELISLGKEASLHSIREAFRILQDRSLVARLVKEIAPLFKERNGGYTRVIHLGNRRGDGAQLAILELTEKVKEKTSLKKKKKAQAPEKPKEEKPKEKPKKEKEHKVVKEELAKQEEKPKKEAPRAKEPEPKKEPQPKKEGLFGKIKGFFKKKD